MRVLLDTHILLWWLAEPERLNTKARRLLEDEENEVLLSSISVLEVVIRTSLGKLQLQEPPEQLIERVIAEQALVPLSIRHDHALAVASLPRIHADPFDRLLIAQSRTEAIPLLTADAIFRSYELDLIWAGARRR